MKINPANIDDKNEISAYKEKKAKSFAIFSLLHLSLLNETRKIQFDMSLA
jgi:hypothetical protein